MKKLAGIVALSFLGVADNAAAGRLIDFLRSYDMNDYALGVAVSMRQNPFLGGENSTFAYPFLTSFTHSSMTDGWFLIRDGGYGVRWVTDNDWELGVIARIRTRGFGNSEAEELVGIADRKWAPAISCHIKHSIFTAKSTPVLRVIMDGNKDTRQRREIRCQYSPAKNCNSSWLDGSGCHARLD